MKEIDIKGKKVLLDDDIYEQFKNVGLYLGATKKYVMFSRNSKHLYLHRIIMGATKRTEIVDHINGNIYDNRRENLRIGNKSGNGSNLRHLPTHNTSGFKGVAFDKVNNKWRAQIQVNGKSIKIGRFKDKIDAAKAYDEAAIKYFGEFACTNKDLGLLKE